MSDTPGSHLDSSGRVRVRSERWGVNLFTTRQDASRRSPGGLRYLDSVRIMAVGRRAGAVGAVR